jgi:hypothetical protein
MNNLHWFFIYMIFTILHYSLLTPSLIAGLNALYADPKRDKQHSSTVKIYYWIIFSISIIINIFGAIHAYNNPSPIISSWILPSVSWFISYCLFSLLQSNKYLVDSKVSSYFSLISPFVLTFTVVSLINNDKLSD